MSADFFVIVEASLYNGYLRKIGVLRASAPQKISRSRRSEILPSELIISLIMPIYLCFDSDARQ